MRSKLRGVAAALSVAVMAGALSVTAAGATNIGNEGCTPGYWKNHTSAWEEYTTTTTLDELFDFPDALASFRTKTLADALAMQGGPTVSAKTEILMRAAAAAFLNAAHEGLGYPYRRFTEPFNIQAQVNGALASLDKTRIVNLAGTLDAANNLGCPL